MKNLFKGSIIFYRSYYTGDDEEILNSAIKRFSGACVGGSICVDEENLNLDICRLLDKSDILFIVGNHDYNGCVKQSVINSVCKKGDKREKFKFCEEQIEDREFCLFVFKNCIIFLLPEEPKILSKALSRFTTVSVIREYLIKRGHIRLCRLGVCHDVSARHRSGKARTN
ncbi:MAG: hypothetical protein LBH37_00845 [Oscillospiraceae bacterium]|jgi:hypothetical protein|nr:hypothetical protein [Oscillospiraceae bacterium]